MYLISQSVLERFITEDIPSLDLTSLMLGLGEQAGHLEFFTRDAITLCGVDEAEFICTRLGLRVESSSLNGSVCPQGATLLRAGGSAAGIHSAWKVSLNLLEYASGIATTTAAMVAKVQAVNPAVQVLTTRKNFPGTKELAVKAILTGGAWPHRLGLSETVLIFTEHMAFLGGLDGFLPMIPGLKIRHPEKKIIAEAAEPQVALALARNGIDGIQVDKMQPESLRDLTKALRQVNPGLVVLAAGGVTLENAGAYAAAGVDGVVTSAPFHARPANFGVRIGPVR